LHYLFLIYKQILIDLSKKKSSFLDLEFVSKVISRFGISLKNS